MCGSFVKAWANVSCKKQPAVGPPPVLIFMVPVVSEPLIDAVPPLPSTALLIDERFGDGPVKLI